MKIILTISLFFVALFADVYAGPHYVDKKREVTGVVAGYDKSKGILVLKDFTDWDRAQMDEMRMVAQMRKDKRLSAWFDQQDKKHAAIYIKIADVRGIREGTKISITGYHYISDERTVIPEYDKLEIVPKK